MEHSKQITRNVLNGILLLTTLTLTFACTPQDTFTVKTDETAPRTQAQGPVAPATVEDDTSPELDYSEYLSVSLAVGERVDQYQAQEELLKTRSIVNSDTVDKCNSDKNVNANNNFADQIAFYTEQMMASVPAKIGIIGSYYGAPSKDESYFPTSLISHPLCTSTTASLTSTIKKVPSQKVIDKLNRFALKVNTLRNEAITGNSVSKVELMKTWTKLFSCMAYTESLGSADSSTSRNVASSNAPTGYSKPSGVEFYNDPSQDAASRLNIGLFQFTPNSSGNIKRVRRLVS